MSPDFPPSGWKQQIRRGLPFPPGVDDQEFEILKDRVLGEDDWQTYHFNITTGEVFHETNNGKWDQPPWSELPPFVRAQVHQKWKPLDPGNKNAVT